MYINREQLNARLKSESDSPVHSVRGNVSGNVSGEIRHKTTGVNRTSGKERLTETDREVVGTLAKLEGATKAAEALGVKQSTAQTAKQGLTTDRKAVDTDLKEKVDKNTARTLESVQDLVLENLSAALTEVSDKISGTKAVEASKIALDMTKILDRATGRDGGKGNKVAVIIHAPGFKSERDFEVVSV